MRVLFYAIPIVFATVSVLYLIYKVRESKKTGDSAVKEEVRTVQDYHKIRNNLRYP